MGLGAHLGVDLHACGIGFRLDEQSERILTERARRLQTSPHLLAREYVLEILQQAEERAALREAICELYRAQQQFRSDFAFAVEALLTSAGEISQDEARRWVEKSLTPE
jgi:hypothetical protein